MHTAQRELSLDELLKEASGLYKVVGRRQLYELARIFGLRPVEMHTIYLHKLSTGFVLPPLVVLNDLLNELDLLAC